MIPDTIGQGEEDSIRKIDLDSVQEREAKIYKKFWIGN